MIFRINSTVLYIVFLFLVVSTSTSLAIDNKLYIDVVDAEAPYFSFDNNQNEQGFIFDLFQTMNNEKYDLVFLTDTLQHKSKEIILGYVSEKEVPNDYYFIQLPHCLNYYVFTRKKTEIKALNDLLNKKIIILKDDLTFDMLYRLKASHILEVKSYSYALNKLAKGMSNCAIVPYQIGMDIIDKQNLKNIDYIITPLFTFNFGIAIPKGEVELIAHFESAINQSVNDNKYKSIEKKWFYDLSSKNTELYRINNLLLIIIAGLVIVVLLLIVFVKFMKYEINASTRNTINELSQSNYSPLTIDITNPLINNLLLSAPLWLFISDINGKIYKISKHMLLDIFNDTEKPEDLKISDIFTGTLSNKMASLDRKLVSQKSNLIVEPIKFEINSEKFNKILIKYPLRIIDNNRGFFLNIITKPIIEGDFNIDALSPGYIFSSVVDAIPDLIYIKNTKGEYLGGNKSFFKFHDKSEGDVIGKNDYEISNEEDAERYSKSDSIVLKSGIVWDNTSWETMINGQSVKFESIKIPLRNKKNEIFGLVGISHDVTRRDKYEKDLEAAKEKVEESDRIKSSFLANMSHEIRTPMNSIIGFSDLLADPDLTIDQRVDIIDMIQTNGHTLIDLIDDIIDFSRLESGKVHLKYSDFNLNTIFEDAYDYGILKKNQLGKEHLNISFTIGSVEDVLMIHSDPFRLRQVLKNLLNNSIRFSTSESLFFGYVINDDDLLMYIKNDNNKISDDVIANLHLEEAETELNFSEIEESSGIALIIAKKVIEMVGGKLYSEELVAGRPNFYFSIPLRQADVIAAPTPQNDIIEIPDWSGKFILIAEDEEINFLLIAEILSKTKVEIIRASDGAEAIELFKEHESKIDLILMDIRMPNINGVAASRKILEIKPSTIIIAQTAYVMPEDKEQYLNVGLKSVLSKPIDPSELYYTCSKYLKK